jgi:hypothetical protein
MQNNDLETSKPLNVLYRTQATLNGGSMITLTPHVNTAYFMHSNQSFFIFLTILFIDFFSFF